MAKEIPLNFAKIRQLLNSFFLNLFFCATFRGIGRNEHVLTIVNVGNIGLNLITADKLQKVCKNLKIWNDREMTLTSLKNICNMHMALINFDFLVKIGVDTAEDGPQN